VVFFRHRRFLLVLFDLSQLLQCLGDTFLALFGGALPGPTLAPIAGLRVGLDLTLSA
jgi:hypothetical protein